ncbi:DUF1642 domain-containing protein [Lactococcus petauri]|uniref:DUF1642 domain-containing protein n=1 Tax=Lactococcus petauri TaxID=1940789 RepID=UPI0028918ABF|nr:DUF1642 domain-containing protein [Lactococcus petauri]MDT2594364.1 DUF1642 domain-containing protein [Lactococcus petauri]
MKKFEEEVKRPVIGIEQSSIKPSLGKAIEFYTDKVKEYHNAFNEMNKYIDGLEAQLDYYKKDKRFEVMAEEIIYLKSQLEKQQPEIPEFMAKAVEEFKKQPDSYKGFSKVNEVWSWINEYQMNNDDFGICGLNNKFFVLAHFAINGYTVAKEKRFYLKNKITKQVLAYDDSPELREVSELFALSEFELENYTFTQQEIDSMETGSYEQIEVEV